MNKIDANKMPSINMRSKSERSSTESEGLESIKTSTPKSTGDCTGTTVEGSASRAAYQSVGCRRNGGAGGHMADVPPGGIHRRNYMDFSHYIVTVLLP